jgi:hypothetical protein
MCAEMGRDIMKKDGRGDGSKTYPALYINQCSITDLYNICPVNPHKRLLTKLLLLTNAMIPQLHWYNPIVTFRWSLDFLGPVGFWPH